MITRNRPDTLEIRLNERMVGTLTRLPNETIVFVFDPSYQEDPERPTLSLCYKTPTGTLHIDRPRTGPRLSPFFSNLLPEGHLRDYLAQKLEIATHREFYLLAGLGSDLPGAVIADPLGELSQTSDMENRSKDNTKHPLLRFSLAGVQLKFSAMQEAKGTFTVPADGAGGSWIVKLPSERFLQVPETEFSMLKLAKLVGITVPECKLIPTTSIDGLPEEFRSSVADSLAVKRFDRIAGGGRIHMEDFAQVYNIYPQDKYTKAGYAHIGQVLWAEDGENSYTEFVRRLVFTVAIGNGDMHLKNWSLLYSDPLRPVLSPAYDFVPSVAYIENDSLALNLGGTKNFQEITLEKFKKMAQQAKAPEKLTATIANETIEKIHDTWQQHRFDLKLPSEVRQIIDTHMSKIPLFKAAIANTHINLVPLLKNIVITGIEYDPIVDNRTMILEASTGNTTAVRAPERMEPDLIKEAAQQGLLPDLAEGPVRVFVGEMLYRQWRRIQFITIDSHPRVTIKKDIAAWRGQIESLSASYSSDAWQKIVSAFQRQSMEEFDVIQSDGSIRTFKARVLSIGKINRTTDDGLTAASIELNIQNESRLLDPFIGISHLLSDFNIRELQEAVEKTLRRGNWETGMFSEPKRVLARNKIRPNKGKEGPEAHLEVEIVFQDDERKTDLLIRVVDVDGKLTRQGINKQAHKLRQDILKELTDYD